MSESIDEFNAQALRVWTEFQAALSTLRPEVRAAFLLHEVFQANYEDSARIIGIPLATCRDHVQVARHRTQTRLQRAGLSRPEPVR